MIFNFSVSQEETREGVKQLLFDKIQGSSHLEGFPCITIGRDSYIVSANNENGLDFSVDYVYNLQVGKFCAIAHSVSFYIDMNHDYTKPAIGVSSLFDNQGCGLKRKGQILIQNDVWIGRGVCIMGGVTIHNGAVIAANSVVTKDVEPYSIVGGNPAKLIKYRFDEDVRKKMLAIQWWDWENERIAANRSWFSSSIEDFVDEFYEKKINTNKKLDIKKSPQSYLFFLDFEEKYSLWEKVILEFCQKYGDSEKHGIILFLKNNEQAVENYKKIEDLVKDIEAKCQITVHCGEDADIKSIFNYADILITNRTIDTVYHSCLANLNGLELISGVDIPIF